MGNNKGIKSVLEEIGNTISSAVDSKVEKTKQDIERQGKYNPSAAYAKNKVRAEVIGMTRGQKDTDGNFTFDDMKDQLEYTIAMKSAHAVATKYSSGVAEQIERQAEQLNSLAGKYTAADEGAIVTPEIMNGYKDQAKKISQNLNRIKADVEKNRGILGEKTYQGIMANIANMQTTAKGMETRKAWAYNSPMPGIGMGAADTDGNGKKDSFVPGGQLMLNQTKQNFDSDVKKALGTYAENHDIGFEEKSKEEQQRGIYDQLNQIEATYTPKMVQKETVGLKTGPELPYSTAEMEFQAPKKLSENEIWNLWDGLQQKLSYVLYSGAYTEEEAQKIADRVYQVKNQYEEFSQNQQKNDPQYISRVKAPTGSEKKSDSALNWQYGDTAEDFMKEFRYQNETTLTREKIPYMSFDQLLPLAFGKEEINRITRDYLANANLTKEEYDRFISGVKDANRNGEITEDAAAHLIGQRQANGLNGNAEGINNALNFHTERGTMEMSGKGVGLGGDIGVEQIFSSAPEALDQGIRRTSGYINEAAGGVLEMMGFDVGKDIAAKGQEQQNYRSEKLKDSQQVQYNWQRGYNEALEGVDSRIGRWFASNVPGLVSSTMGMAVSSIAGGLVQQGVALAGGSMGTPAVAGALNQNTYDAYKAFEYGVKNAGLFAMSGNAALNTYAEKAEDERLSASQKVIYSVADGAAEFLTEKLFGGNPLLDTDETGAFTRMVYELTDNGTFDSITKTWLECVRDGSWRALAQKVVSSEAFDMVGEGLEEVVSSIGMMGMDYATYGKSDTTPESLANDFATGVMLSMFLTGGRKMLEVFSPVNEEGEYKKLKYFSEEQQVSRDSMDAQMMLYAVKYLGGDVELMENSGLTQQEAQKAGKEFERIKQEYHQATWWMNQGTGAELSAEQTIRAAQGAYGDVDIRFFTPETAAYDAMDVVQAWEKMLEEEHSPANIIPIASNFARMAQAAEINLENGINMGVEDPSAAADAMEQVQNVGTKARQMVETIVDVVSGKKNINFMAGEQTTWQTEQQKPETEPYTKTTEQPAPQGEQITRTVQTEEKTQAAGENQRVEQTSAEVQNTAEMQKKQGQVMQEQDQPMVNQNGGTDYGRKEVFDDSGKRHEGMGAGEQGGAVAGSTGETAKGRRNSRSAAVEIRRAIQNGETQKVTAHELGVKGGSKTEAVDILNDEAVSHIDSLKTIREDAEKDGATVEFFAGKLKVYNKTKKRFTAVEGIRMTNADGSTRYLIKADGAVKTAEMIYRHESAHDMLEKNPEKRVGLVNQFYETYTTEEANRLIAAYCEAYNGIYGVIEEGMTADEQMEIELAYVNEILADVYAGIRRGNANLGTKRETLRSQVEDAMQTNRENRAAMERRNGPGGDKYSIENVDGEKQEYENCVILDTKIFDGVSPRKWGEVLGRFVYQNLAGETLKIYDESGNPETVEVARLNDRVKKDGANNSHKVIDKLARYNGDNIKALSTIHLSELLEASGNESESKEHKHQWMDEKGWTYRHTYVADRNGNIYDATLNIANGREKRIIYAINNVKMIDTKKRETGHGVVPSTENGRGSHINTSLSKETVPQTRQNVKQKFSVEDEVQKLDEEYRRSTEEKTRYIEGEEQKEAPRGIHPADAPQDLNLSESEIRRQARTEAQSAEAQAMRTAQEEENQSEAMIRLKAKEAGNQALSNKIKQTQRRIGNYRFAERNGIITEEMKGELWRAERTLTIQQEELQRRRKEERTLREKVRIEQAERQKPTEAKKKLKKDLLEIYFIPEGQRDVARQWIEQYANKIMSKGRITNEEKNEMLDLLYKKGMVRVGPDDYYGEIRSYLMGGRIYVPESLREEFGDDWETFRREAWGAGVYLTRDTTDMGTDVWLSDLANMFPGGFSEETDLKEGLEQIVRFAQEGRAENLTLNEMMRRNQDDYGWSIEEQMEDMERRAEQALTDFGNMANLEVKIRRESAYKEIAARNKYREMMEKYQKDRQENQIRNEVMGQIKALQRMRNRTPPEIKEQIDKVLKGIDTIARSISEKGLEDLQALEAAYRAARGDENFIPNEYLESRIARLHLKQIDDMDLDEVVELGKTVMGIVHDVQTRNKMLGDSRNEEISTVAKRAIGEIRATKGSNGGTLYKWAVENHLSPVRFIKMLGGWLKDGEMTQLAYDLEKGQTKQLDYVRQATRIFDPLTQDKHMQDWMKTASGKNAKLITIQIPTTESGTQTIKITPMMRVSLYLHSLNYDNLRHIDGGGLTIPNMELYKAGKLDEAYARGTKIKMNVKTVKGIAAGMTAEEKRFAQAMQRYFNEFSTGKINEVSMILDGFERAGGKNYYHIKVDKDYMENAANEQVKRDIAVASIGSITHERTSSRLPIILEDANTALQEHIENVSKYYGLAIPIRDVEAVLKYTVHKEGETFADSLPKVMKSKWGAGSVKYMDKLMADLQGGSGTTDMLGRALANLRGKLAGATLAFNPSVALSQFASYPGAAQVVGFKALAHGLKFWEKVDMDLIEKYTPLLWYRNQGNSTQELGDYMKDQPIEKKLPALLNWIQQIDVGTVRRLWAASEYYVRDTTDLRPGSQTEIDSGTDEYYRAVAEVFNRAVYDTQPNYTTMQRTEISRTDNELVKFLTMYKTVPLQYYNMTFEAIGTYQAASRRYEEAKKSGNQTAQEEAKEEKKNSKSYLARTVAGLLAANVLYNAIKVLIRIARGKDDRYRDDEGEITVESVLAGFGVDLAEIYAGSLIGGAEIVSVLELAINRIAGGNKTFSAPENSALEYIADTVNAGADIISAIADGEWRDVTGSVKKEIKQIAMAWGIPAKNIEDYILTAVKFASPEAYMKYQNLFGEVTRSSLAKKGNGTVDAAITVIMGNRTEDLNDNTIEEVQRLWGKGYRDAVPSVVPEKITMDGNEVALNKSQRNAYRDAWSREVSENLEQLMDTEEYQGANDETKAKLIKKLYAYADSVAKAAANAEFKPEAWVANADGDLTEYISYMVMRNEISRDKSREENAIAMQTVVAHDAGGITTNDAEELARLYADNYGGIMPNETPDKITYKDDNDNEVEVVLSTEQREAYREVYRNVADGNLTALMESKEYTDADDKKRASMVKSLWTFCSATAKNAVDENVEPDKWIADGLDLMKNGVELSQYIAYRDKAKELDGKNNDGEAENGLKDSRRIDLINRQNWTAQQREEAYRDSASDSNTKKLNELKEAGLSWDQASKVLKVTGEDWNKIKMIAGMGLPNRKAAMAAMVFLSDNQKIKVEVGTGLGIKLTDYVEVVSNADVNNSGTIDQKEAKDYIAGMGLGPQESAWLWQMVCNTTTAKKNPFSTTFGWEYVDRLPDDMKK